MIVSLIGNFDIVQALCKLKKASFILDVIIFWQM